VDKGGEAMFVCCEEHVELAIDMYVDKADKAPEITYISVDNREKQCDFCSNQAVYMVGN
jgi:CxxH/CxxC protein (TIGR04129 family)